MAKEQKAPGELELVREFVNTADREAGEEHLGTPEELRAWLSERGLLPRSAAARPADLAQAHALREALRRILLAHNGGPVPGAALQTLDDTARRAGLRLRFHPDGAELEPEGHDVDAALARLLLIVHEAIAQGRWERLKACRDETCEWAFYDHTKNRSGAWCNMGVCGNRAKARAYRRRQSGETA